MPSYTWKNKDTGETVDVVRPISESNIPPEQPGDWTRVINPAPIHRGPNWGKKGEMK